MKIMGLDLGSRTCGIALSDSSHILATGIETFNFKDDDYDSILNYLENIIVSEKVEEIALGYPKNMNNTIGERATICEKFKESLEARYNVKVLLVDERLTTRQVTNVLIDANVSRKKRKKQVDKLAATLILQSYLDSRKRF